VLAGKYRVDHVLGVGGMGVVVAAHHLGLDEKVAIKVLRPEAMAAPEAVVRFEREARAAVKIKSEHVARVIDVGALDNGAPYMIMEYLEGSDLSDWLTAYGRLPIDEAVDFVLQACEAIAEAHAMGIIHRDLKPANLFCARRPDGTRSIKVLDFGISKVTGVAAGPGLGMTRTQAILGSPLYMSPEQLESSKGVDARADIWALGVILYQLLTGALPFASEIVTELAIRIVNHPTPPARALRPDVPPKLEAAIGRCLEKDRDRRFANVAELARALADFAPPRALLSLDRITGVMQSALAPPPPTPVATPPLVVTRPVGSTVPTMPLGPAHGTTPASWAGSEAGPFPRAAPPRRSHAIPLAVAIATLVLVVGGGAVLLAARASKAPRTVASSTPGPPSTNAVASAALPTGIGAELAAPSTPAPISPSPSSGSPSPGMAGKSPGIEASQTAPPVAGVATTGARPPSSASPHGAATKPSVVPKKADCDPPYFVDAEGHRQYKRECF
jgi:serine/threonine-protein kinase